MSAVAFKIKVELFVYVLLVLKILHGSVHLFVTSPKLKTFKFQYSMQLQEMACKAAGDGMQLQAAVGDGMQLQAAAGDGMQSHCKQLQEMACNLQAAAAYRYIFTNVFADKIAVTATVGWSRVSLLS